MGINSIDLILDTRERDADGPTRDPIQVHIDRVQKRKYPTDDLIICDRYVVNNLLSRTNFFSGRK